MVFFHATFRALACDRPELAPTRRTSRTTATSSETAAKSTRSRREPSFAIGAVLLVGFVAGLATGGSYRPTQAEPIPSGRSSVHPAQ